MKVLCFDFGGVVLALSAGILFGGVIQGAVCSAAAATIGSSVAFFLAKADTPVRKKALEVVDEYPSLRGIERVVAEDGLKAILTLRLAPLLPIPIGMYNYVYGVTNVPYFDFAAGVFLGSLKPYLLDSYLGVFGKQVVEGTAGDPGGISLSSSYLLFHRSTLPYRLDPNSLVHYDSGGSIPSHSYLTISSMYGSTSSGVGSSGIGSGTGVGVGIGGGSGSSSIIFVYKLENYYYLRYTFILIIIRILIINLNFVLSFFSDTN